MIRLLALSRGGVKCSSACPYYEESGLIEAYNGPMKTHCRAVMEDVVVNCDTFNPHKIRYADISEEKLESISKTLGISLKRVRKLYPREHKEIHPVGWKPARQDSAENLPEESV